MLPRMPVGKETQVVLLRTRGIRTSLGVLHRRTVLELREARRWAQGLLACHAMPAWLKAAIGEGRARHVDGVCRECACTDFRACEGGCTWAVVDQRIDRTLCSQCQGGLGAL